MPFASLGKVMISPFCMNIEKIKINKQTKLADGDIYYTDCSLKTKQNKNNKANFTRSQEHHEISICIFCGRAIALLNVFF